MQWGFREDARVSYFCRLYLFSSELPCSAFVTPSPWCGDIRIRPAAGTYYYCAPDRPSRRSEAAGFFVREHRPFPTRALVLQMEQAWPGGPRPRHRVRVKIARELSVARTNSSRRPV